MQSPSPAPIGATSWTAEQVAGIDPRAAAAAPLIEGYSFRRVSPKVDIWDAWPVQDEDGSPSELAEGTTLWMALASPRFPDPDERHGHARIHLLQQGRDGWLHLGPVMPDDFSPGSREWSGSAVLDRDRTGLRLYFTATGRRGESPLTFEQRLFSAKADLAGGLGHYQFENWRELREIVSRDPTHYMASDAGDGAVGTIKAFRDPAFFRDPSNGCRYLFFAGSRADAKSRYNGVIGAARSPAADGEQWQIMAPLIDATAVNNELERPHVIFCGERYYLFWSTQTHVFDPDGPTGPTGLYGMVADELPGPWEPLNGTGLVFANPPEAPRQAYSWLVLPDLSVISFVDDWGHGRTDKGERRFGATFAPVLRLQLDGRHGRLRA